MRIMKLMYGWSFSKLSKNIVLWTIRVIAFPFALLGILAMILVVPIALIKMLDDWIKEK